MKAIDFVAWITAIVLTTTAVFGGEDVAAPSPATGSRPAIVGQTLDNEALGKMLKGMGYEPEKIEKQGFVIYRIKVQSQHEANYQALTLDSKHNTVILCGGGFLVEEQRVRDAAVVYRKVLEVCQNLDSSKIAINSSGQLILQSYIGNTRITPVVLRTAIEENLRQVDGTLFPLWNDLQMQTASVDSAGNLGVQTSRGVLKR